MKKIRTILIDDEPLCTEGLAYDIKECCDALDVINTYNDPRKALDEIHSIKPDLIFLDIEMPWLNGFEFLNSCEHIDFKVIFVTAYDEFAVQAFRSHAIDYLMKPVSRSMLKDAVDRAADQIRNEVDYRAKIDSVLNAINANVSRKLSVPNSNGYDLIPIEDILYCKAIGNYTEIHIQNEKKVVTRVLKSIEASLQGHSFLRVHASYLVNLEKIKSIYRNDGGYIIMENEDRINISRNKKSDVFALFKN